MWIFLKWQIALGFIIGSVLSMLAAYVGMRIATNANVRTANAAISSSGKATVIAFRGGSVMGLSIVGMSLLGIYLLFTLFGKQPSLLVGYGFGASLAALFAAIIGDTFGDPLKDTAGPSLHILVKLENILSITLLPLFMSYALSL